VFDENGFSKEILGASILAFQRGIKENKKT
jgi:hypothetical protein